jgi:hypothetical protein
VRTFVWVDAWQQQCCGDEFRVGSQVRWNVDPVQDQGWVASLLGSEWATQVRYSENHHGPDELGDEMHAVVRSIRAVTCDRGPQPDPNPSGRAWVVIPGSGQLREVEVADPRGPEPRSIEPRHTFEGWIVEVDAEQLT